MVHGAQTERTLSLLKNEYNEDITQIYAFKKVICGLPLPQIEKVLAQLLPN